MFFILAMKGMLNIFMGCWRTCKLHSTFQDVTWETKIIWPRRIPFIYPVHQHRRRVPMVERRLTIDKMVVSTDYQNSWLKDNFVPNKEVPGTSYKQQTDMEVPTKHPKIWRYGLGRIRAQHWHWLHTQARCQKHFMINLNHRI